MDYYYETLTNQKFQKLCQSIIESKYPDTQCFPVEQPDGGRDAIAFLRDPTQEGFIVFQIKFSKNPEIKDERDSIKDLIISEKAKVKILVGEGAKRYIFITNVRGTGHLGTGSIDKLEETNKELMAEFGIPTEIWWRDKLDRALDSQLDIKWSYPEILKATDIIPILICNNENWKKINHAEVARAVKGYIATQYTADRDVKFKQVELQRKLADIFVDLPLGLKQNRVEQNRQRRLGLQGIEVIDFYISQLEFEEDYEMDHPFQHSGLAGAFLLQMPQIRGVTRFVVEGAPGQGKSTVTQFLCQINRLRLLKKEAELQSVDIAHKSALVRVPFRVDLRDYAAWVNGRDPFSNISESKIVASSNQALEGFLARQVSAHSGGLEIAVGEIIEFLANSHSVIVLDGFDEVADIGTRERIVTEICSAAERLSVSVEDQQKSMQIIVTSRPAAFANSPGFPEDSWTYLELRDLRSKNIEAYKDKWISAQNLNKEEGDLVSSTLNDKLEQPHLRDLARNPMQLAILLHLIHVQGVALPEKRTTLYEEYMKLFFNREAEKSKIVRDHRELLLSIHGLLAWVLHTQAEEGAGSGSITRDDLYNQVKTYLVQEEHDSELAEELLKGTVERVGALVSRVEGMFEFEVQPLREYFAARHLYKTAPYSPVGQAHKGTRPERFEAIAASSYWTNVTRFFCGFYDVGELAGLLEGIMDLSEQEGYKLINQPRRLAIMMLSDQVFSQAPRIMRRLVDFISGEPDFYRLIATTMTQAHRELALPNMAGGKILVEHCEEKLKVEKDRTTRKALRRVIAANASNDKLKEIWFHRYENGLITDKVIPEIVDFGLENQFSFDEIVDITGEDFYSQIRWLIMVGDYDKIVDSRALHQIAKNALFDGRLEFPIRWRHQTDSALALEVLAEFLRPHTLVAVFHNNEESRTMYNPLDIAQNPRRHALIERMKQRWKDGADDPFESFALYVGNSLSKDFEEWRKELVPWSDLVDRGLELIPSNYLMVRTALVATASRARPDAGEWDEDGFCATKGLVNRLLFARFKADDADWWSEKLANMLPETAVQCLTVLITWGKPHVLINLIGELDSRVEKLSRRDWARLYSLFGLISRTFEQNLAGVLTDSLPPVSSISSRTALLLIDRIDDPEIARRLSRHYFLDYRGDDAQIVRRACQIEFQVAEEPIDWDYIRHLSSHARRKGIRTIFPMPGPLGFRIPEEVAKSVLHHCNDHHPELVTICEQAYATSISQSVPRVSQVAKEHNWFAPLH